MDRRLALVAVWALFAVAAVGVGFGAAGLVGDPFTDGPDPVGGAAAGPTTTTSSPPTTASPSRSPRPRSSGSAASDGAAEAVTRSVSTRGGLVSATCRAGMVRLAASPAVGWEIDDLDSGARSEARARFERVDDGDGRVEVQVTCVGGVPHFEVEDDSSGSGSGGSGSDGSDD